MDNRVSVAEPSLVIAECPACGEQRFRGPSEAPDDRDIVTCEYCGLKLTFGFLQSRMVKAAAANDGPKHKGKRKAAVRPRQRKRG
jgi:hypothetical protein